uniref:Uncharacterized protein n=1 Tax=Myotis myotis TaxID=51298 RepID=A0A7J7ZX20_MYOMY|nr:hypothetical protein mMyoMyo1_009640 [Myotis myotis]
MRRVSPARSHGGCPSTGTVNIKASHHLAMMEARGAKPCYMQNCGTGRGHRSGWRWLSVPEQPRGRTRTLTLILGAAEPLDGFKQETWQGPLQVSELGAAQGAGSAGEEKQMESGNIHSSQLSTLIKEKHGNWRTTATLFIG